MLCIQENKILMYCFNYNNTKNDEKNHVLNVELSIYFRVQAHVKNVSCEVVKKIIKIYLSTNHNLDGTHKL